MNFVNWLDVSVLLGVIAIDLSLAVDNAVVMGVVAAKLPQDIRRKTILFGVIAAAFFRIIFSTVALRLLSFVGLALAGGFLLLWVAWKLWRELHPSKRSEKPSHLVESKSSFRQAVWRIFIADVSMSLDNVLAVAGTARHHLWIMVFGLTLSVALMSIAANVLAGIIQRHPWISYVGLAIVFYVAVTMILEGGHQVAGFF